MNSELDLNDETRGYIFAADSDIPILRTNLDLLQTRIHHIVKFEY